MTLQLGPATTALVPLPRTRPAPPTASPNPRVACVLVLDTSSSMSGDGIAQLNAGVRRFARSVKSDRLSAADVEVAVVGVGGDARVLTDFAPAAAWEPAAMRAGGGTPLGRGVLTALALTDRRLAVYRDHDFLAHPPMAVLITDGEETDSPGEFDRAAEVMRDLERRDAIRFYPVGVDGADMRRLAALSIRPPYALRELNFDRFFDWLARSVRQVSRSVVGGEEWDDPAAAGVADRYEG
jgi:uncharacterized protein YegL